MIPAPAHVFGISGRYAHALYSAATKKNVIDVVAKEISMLDNMLKTNEPFHGFIHNTSLQKSAKGNGIDAILTKGKYSPDIQKFCRLLTDNSRLDKLGDIIIDFNKLMDAKNNIVHCQVTSAFPFSNKKKSDEVDKILSQLIPSDKKLVINKIIDPTILGGLVVEFGDHRRIDMSTISAIRRIEDDLSKVAF